MLLDQLQRVVNDGQRRQPKKVHLEQRRASPGRPCRTASQFRRLFVTYSGTSSLSGTDEITTPAACMPALRAHTFQLLATSSTSFTRGSFAAALQLRLLHRRFFELDVELLRNQLR